MVTSPEFVADYFGPAAVQFASKEASAKLADGKANPEAFWVLEGYLDSYKSLRSPVRSVLNKWKPKVRCCHHGGHFLCVGQAHGPVPLNH